MFDGIDLKSESSAKRGISLQVITHAPTTVTYVRRVSNSFPARHGRLQLMPTAQCSTLAGCDYVIPIFDSVPPLLLLPVIEPGDEVFNSRHVLTGAAQHRARTSLRYSQQQPAETHAAALPFNAYAAQAHGRDRLARVHVAFAPADRVLGASTQEQEVRRGRAVQRFQ